MKLANTRGNKGVAFIKILNICQKGWTAVLWDIMDAYENKKPEHGGRGVEKE